MKILLKYNLIFILLFSLNSTCQSNKSLSGGIYNISNFIASDYFSTLKRNNTDLELVDTIYLRALKYFDNDISEALLALTFATLPFNKMPLKLPIIDVTLNIPLPSVSDSLFNLKVKNLPSQLFFDSPKVEFGDKDKVPHFFGNAFLSYSISLFNISEFLGILVELFEDSFKIEGRLDLRDLYINRLGSFYGEILDDKPELLPSEMFLIYSIIHNGINL
ncbi:MAG: hypothetical protein JXA68_00415 [Ignavibacteriales bacterium]|nr:hypothetical protein [Ignavibacteriales bacterium]